MIKLMMDIMMAINKAIPNPDISNELPISSSVSNNVIALITNKNIPSVKTVTGKVKIIKIGLTNIFKTESKKLAPKAAPKLDK